MVSCQVGPIGSLGAWSTAGWTGVWMAAFHRDEVLADGYRGGKWTVKTICSEIWNMDWSMRRRVTVFMTAG
jgi:hypothetical protein